MTEGIDFLIGSGKIKGNSVEDFRALSTRGSGADVERNLYVSRNDVCPLTCNMSRGGRELVEMGTFSYFCCLNVRYRGDQE